MTAVGVMDLRVTSEVDVRDQLLVGELGAVRVGKMSTYQEGGARRTAKLIRQDDPDFCKIDILARGQGVVAQDRREALLRPGDLVFVDLSKPADWRMSAMEIVAVSFPRTLLPLRPDDLSRLTGVSIPGDRGTASLISRCSCPNISTTRARELDSAPRCSTCSPRVWRPAWTAKARYRPKLGSTRCWCAFERGSRSTSATPGCPLPMLLRHTIFRCVTCTSCSRASRRRWRAGSGGAAWNTAVANCATRPRRCDRSARSPPAGEFSTRPTSAGCSGTRMG
jgi:AraC-binding-like domain